MQNILDAAVAANDVPFVVAMTGDAKGVNWAGAAGDCAPGRPAGVDTVYRIFSMTKAVGSTAAMILIDRGLLDFDTPVESVLPGFADLKVLTGFDGDKPLLRAPKTRATVRQLATHTSGLCYEFWHADFAKYLQVTGAPTILSGLKASLQNPLVCDPGDRWEYGTGIDWLGQMVEAVDGRRIDQFCREEIFDRLGMTDTAFEPGEAMQPRLSAVSIRNEAGQFEPMELAPPPQPEIYGMGHALYSTPQDYMRFLRLFLNRGVLDGQRILSEKAVTDMLANHIGKLRMGVMKTVAPAITADVDMFPGIDKTHSFGFMRNEQDVPGMRSAGSQSWAGVCNSHYWFDPSRDIAAVIMTQSLPFVEPRFMKTYTAFEQAVYAR